jgi:hypothetical protein
MKRATLVAVAAFGVLLLALFATREKNVAVGIQRLEVPSITSASIDSVTVTGANAAKLERSGSGWTVADPAKPETKFPADDSQVQALLTAVADFKAPDFVSDKTDKHAEYEVTAEKGTSVVVTGGGKTLSVVLGKASKSGGTYVRKSDGSAVFATQSGMTWQAKRNVTAWRKKTITTAPLADVTQIDAAGADGSTYSLKAAEGGAWTLASTAPAGFRFDASAAQRVASQLTSLNAQDFLSAPGDYAKAHSFVLALKDGKKVTVTVGATKRDDGNHPLKVEGDAQEYLVPGWIVEQLDKGLGGLRDLSLMNFEVEKATKLTITSGSTKTIVAKEGETWKLVEPKTPPAGVTFEPSQVTSQLNRLKSARATKAVEKAVLGKASVIVEAIVDKRPVTLVFGADTGSNSEVYVQGNADPLVFVTSGADKSSWTTGAQLFNKPPPPPDFGNMQGLEQLPPDIRQKLMEQLKQQRN